MHATRHAQYQHVDEPPNKRARRDSASSQSPLSTSTLTAPTATKALSSADVNNQDTWLKRTIIKTSCGSSTDLSYRHYDLVKKVLAEGKHGEIDFHNVDWKGYKKGLADCFGKEWNPKKIALFGMTEDGHYDHRITNGRSFATFLEIRSWNVSDVVELQFREADASRCTPLATTDEDAPDYSGIENALQNPNGDKSQHSNGQPLSPEVESEDDVSPH